MSLADVQELLRHRLIVGLDGSLTPYSDPPSAPPALPNRTLDELLYHWRAVIDAAPEGFPRDFALSIQKARKRPAWQPSARQLVLMQRMVSELFTARDDLPLFDGADGELTLIERG